MHGKTASLVDHVNCLQLQRLQDHISRATNLTSIILDLSGEPATSMSNTHGLCSRLYKDDPSALSDILENVYQATMKNSASAVCACPRTGLIFASVPLEVDDQFIGIWVVGQIRLRGSSPIHVNRVAQELGFSREEIEECLEELPTLGYSELQTIVNLIAVWSKEFIAITYVAKDLEKEYSALNASHESLVDATHDLFAFFDSPEVGRMVCDLRTQEILLCNKTLAGYFDMLPQELVGSSTSVLFNWPDRRTWIEAVDVEENWVQNWELQFEDKGLYLYCTSVFSKWHNGRELQITTCVNTSQLYQMQRQLNEIAYYDRVMGIPNNVCLEMELEDTSLYEALIALDIDQLRRINDIYGRGCGDILLCALRDFIQELCVTGSSLYSLDLANIAILLQKNMEHPSAMEIAERLRERCNHPWRLDIGDQQQELLIQLNICVIPLDDMEVSSIPSLYGAINHTLIIARSIDAIAVYDAETHAAFKRSMRIEMELKKSVRAGMSGFSLHYQPIVNPGTAKWRGLEALCRWQCAELGPVSPGEFIPIAETAGLIRHIGLWVLEQAVMQVKAWQLDVIQDFILEVNLSPVQLVDPQLDQLVLAIMQRHAFPPDKLCLEVTESSEINFSSHTLRALERLSDLGVVIALDDFGTGYASLSALHKLPVKIIKTDRSLITGMESDAFLQKVMQVMVELAHSSDMKIVAEGVENDTQAQLLLRQGADYFQGFYFSRPLTADQLESQIDNFHNISSDLAVMGYTVLDVAHIIDDQRHYELPPDLSRLLNACVRPLLTDHDLGRGIELALEQLGHGLDVSRVYLFQRKEGGSFHCEHHWHMDGTEPLRQIGPDILSALKADMLRNRVLVVPDVRTLEEPACQFLNDKGVRSIAAFPVLNDGTLEGFVGFDDCRQIRHWSGEEIQMLHSLTAMIASTIAKAMQQQKAAEVGAMTEAVLNNMGASVYITDLETDRILFVNTQFQKNYDTPLVGELCWQALYGRSERCTDCPVPALRHMEEQSMQREYFDEASRQHYRVQNSIILWQDDKKAHLHYADKMIKISSTPKRKEPLACTDPALVPLKRREFFNAVQTLLKTSHDAGSPVTLVVIDVHGQQDLAYSSISDDRMFFEVIDALQMNIRANDLIGRYHKGTFALAFAGCSKRIAQDRMEVALLEVVSRKRDSEYQLPNIHYGFAECSELPFIDAAEYAMQLLHVAHTRMLAQKEMLHAEDQNDGFHWLS